jgi:hypothetical protein
LWGTRLACRVGGRSCLSGRDRRYGRGGAQDDTSFAPPIAVQPALDFNPLASGHPDQAHRPSIGRIPYDTPFSPKSGAQSARISEGGRVGGGGGRAKISRRRRTAQARLRAEGARGRGRHGRRTHACGGHDDHVLGHGCRPWLRALSESESGSGREATCFRRGSGVGGRYCPGGPSAGR